MDMQGLEHPVCPLFFVMSSHQGCLSLAIWMKNTNQWEQSHSAATFTASSLSPQAILVLEQDELPLNTGVSTLLVWREKNQRPELWDNEFLAYHSPGEFHRREHGKTSNTRYPFRAALCAWSQPTRSSTKRQLHWPTIVFPVVELQGHSCCFSAQTEREGEICTQNRVIRSLNQEPLLKEVYHWYWCSPTFLSLAFLNFPETYPDK